MTDEAAAGDRTARNLEIEKLQVTLDELRGQEFAAREDEDGKKARQRRKQLQGELKGLAAGRKRSSLERKLKKLEAGEAKRFRGEERKRLQRELAVLKATDSNHKIGLALSGGGYRASLFHLGALWRLNELGWLRKLDYITSVSGGSIVAAFLGTRWSQLNFGKDGVAGNFGDAFLEPMREMFATTIDIPTISQGLLNPFGSVRERVNGKRTAAGTVGLLGGVAEYLGGSVGRSIATSLARPFAPVVATGLDAGAAAWDALNPFPTPAELLIETYDRLLFHGKTLQDLPEPKKNVNPLFILYATNMQTGVSVRMSREHVADYRLGEVKKPDVPLARVVAASSGFPPFYCPVELEIPPERWTRGKAKLFDRKGLRERMDLGDGAVYDNMGLTKLMNNCETILVSDAGDSLDVLDALPFEWLSQAVRTLEVAMDQSNKLRRRELAEEFELEERRGVYWGISKPILDEKPRRAPEHPLPSEGPGAALLKDSERTRALGEMRTRLNRFIDEEQESLINWGYALSDARMRQYVIEPSAVLGQGALPFPDRLV
ncbi:MAG: hypothetical protein GY719_13305 [bacterium]|nr:hypothetical protein [bacterium]